MSRRRKNQRIQQQKTQQETVSVQKTNTGPKAIQVIAVGIGALLIILAATSFMLGAFANGSAASTSSSATAPNLLGGTLAPINNGVQEVSLSMQGYQYQPNPIRVKAGVPVRFTADLNTVRGCMRSIQIPEIGVSGRVSEGNNVIEFTPAKAGTFRMTCSMGMADGTIIVEDANGQVPVTSNSAAPRRAAGVGGSCGAGGGCGCGG